MALPFFRAYTNKVSQKIIVLWPVDQTDIKKSTVGLEVVCGNNTPISPEINDPFFMRADGVESQALG